MVYFYLMEKFSRALEAGSSNARTVCVRAVGLPGRFFVLKGEAMDEKTESRLKRIVDDPSVDYIFSAWGLDEIRWAMKYATENFQSAFELLKKVDRQFDVAVEAGDEKLAQKKDKEFYALAENVAYYDDQAERFTREWAGRTGSAFLTGDKNGLYIEKPQSMGGGKKSS